MKRVRGKREGGRGGEAFGDTTGLHSPSGGGQGNLPVKRERLESEWLSTTIQTEQQTVYFHLSPSPKLGGLSERGA